MPWMFSFSVTLTSVTPVAVEVPVAPSKMELACCTSLTLGGGGDFALGYVLAHEVGHHVQTVLGISEQVQTLQQRVTKKEANALQVKMELQADCFAGVWGHFMEKRGILEAGDLEEALKTATAIGDDRLQKEATGRVVPDSFTHGTSLQRLNWFKKGFKSGNPNVCNTWQADKL